MRAKHPILTDDELSTAAFILCSPERLEIHHYSQDQFDFFCEMVRQIQIAAHQSGDSWLADGLERALGIAEFRFLEGSAE